MNKPAISFSFNKVKPSLQNRKLLKMFIIDLFKKEKTNLANLDYIFCTDEYLLQLNQSFLHHDTYTDIITFDLSSGKAVEGEIYISTERTNENAQLFEISREQELLRVIFHGALHLCGYKDKKEAERKVMRSKENYYLTKFREKVSRETQG